MLSKIPSFYLKYFIYKLSFRRNFIALLSIYFLTLPNTTVNQIGIFAGIWYLLSFLFEVPSWYISDMFGHKKILILSKILQIFSVLFYVGAFFVWENYNFYCFILGSISQTLAFAFSSGSSSSYFYELLSRYWKEEEFGKIDGKIGANVSLLSVLFIVILPFFTQIHILLPFIIWTWVDLIGLWALMLLPNISNKQPGHTPHKWIIRIIQDSFKSQTLHVSLFLAIITGFMMGEHAFRTIYLTDLWYPIILIWMVMGLSRIVWFIVWHTIHHLQGKVALRQLFLYELIIFPFFFAMISFFKNPYVVGILFSIIIWYQWWRTPFMHGILFNEYISDKRYKATVLSLKSQVWNIISVLLTFGLWYIMSYSYQLGYMIFSILMFTGLVGAFYFIYKDKSL